MQFRVWGKIDGTKFDHVFAEWRAERAMIERIASVSVQGMQSVEVAA